MLALCSNAYNSQGWATAGNSIQVSCIVKLFELPPAAFQGHHNQESGIRTQNQESSLDILMWDAGVLSKWPNVHCRCSHFLTKWLWTELQASLSRPDGNFIRAKQYPVLHIAFKTILNLTASAHHCNPHLRVLSSVPPGPGCHQLTFPGSGTLGLLTCRFYFWKEGANFLSFHDVSDDMSRYLWVGSIGNNNRSATLQSPEGCLHLWW